MLRYRPIAWPHQHHQRMLHNESAPNLVIKIEGNKIHSHSSSRSIYPSKFSGVDIRSRRWTLFANSICKHILNLKFCSINFPTNVHSKFWCPFQRISSFLCITIFIISVDLRSLTDENLNHFQMVVLGSNVQRSSAPGINTLNILFIGLCLESYWLNLPSTTQWIYSAASQPLQHDLPCTDSNQKYRIIY